MVYSCPRLIYSPAVYRIVFVCLLNCPQTTLKSHFWVLEVPTMPTIHFLLKGVTSSSTTLNARPVTVSRTRAQLFVKGQSRMK